MFGKFDFVLVLLIANCYEKTPLKVGYFSKIAKTFSTALTAQSAQKQHK